MALCGSKFCKHWSAEIEHLSGRFAVECRGNRTLLTCQCNSSGDDLVVNLIYVARASQIPCPTKICFDEFSSGRDDKKNSSKVCMDFVTKSFRKDEPLTS